MNLPSIHIIPEICHRHELNQAVVSPGSRCAPITIAFARHKGFTTRSISDERSAGFIGLGISLETKKASVLVCTSGTAAANYSPAVIEAWYQQIPLLVLTADRPPEWIDQNDGQCIRQENLYQNHSKGSFQFPVDTTHPDAQWHAQRIVNEAILLAHAHPAGPVHINIPIREPFYPQEALEFAPILPIRNELKGTPELSTIQKHELLSKLKSYKKILLVVGQHELDSSLSDQLNFAARKGIVVVVDVLSNIKSESAIHHADMMFASNSDTADLEPELVITLGKTILSKSLKQFLRKAEALQHWHIQEAGEVADPFKKLSWIIRTSPGKFMDLLQNEISITPEFGTHWKNATDNGIKKLSEFKKENSEWNELKFLTELESRIPDGSIVHLSNSMSVRYASYLGWGKKNLILHCNRGTSGIDGSMSTALGAALSTDKPVYLISGDLSFFYDRNALWNNYLPNNLHVIVLNNHGGAIFSMIDGPARQPEAKEYFVTQQRYSIENTIKDTEGMYWKISTAIQLNESLSAFIKHPGLSFLEIESNVEASVEAFKKLKG